MKSSTRKLFAGLAGLAASLALATAAQGAVMAYTISGAGSGSLGGVTFTDATFDIRLVGDTDNLRDFGFGPLAIAPLDSATVHIDGFSDAALTGPTRFGLARDLNLFFFSRYDGFGGGMDLFDFRVTDAQEAAFDYAASYGPVPGRHLRGAVQRRGHVAGIADVPDSLRRDLPPGRAGAGAWAIMIMGFAGVGALLRRGSRRPSVAVLVSESPSLATQAT